MLAPPSAAHSMQPQYPFQSSIMYGFDHNCAYVRRWEQWAPDFGHGPHSAESGDSERLRASRRLWGGCSPCLSQGWCETFFPCAVGMFLEEGSR